LSSPAARPSPTGGLRPALTPAPGDAHLCGRREQVRRFKIKASGGILWRVGWVGQLSGSIQGAIFLILLRKQLAVEHEFEYNKCMELGDPTAAQTERSRLNVVLDKLHDDLAELVEAVESGGLDQLTAAQKVAVWQRFETLRNRLPLIDHNLIADAEATDLAEAYCSSTVTRFLVQVLQLSPGEAASRVRAAAAVGPRRSMLGERFGAGAAAPGCAATRRRGDD
jgi:Domain of unknown function (DUF222)